MFNQGFKVQAARKTFHMALLVAFVLQTGACSFISRTTGGSTPGEGADRAAGVKFFIDRPETRKKFLIPQQEVVMLPAPPRQITPEVKKELNYLLKGCKSFMNRSLSAREKHHKTIHKIFRDQGLHEELLNVGLIESGYRADAKSPMGATGMWQFMKSTAKIYGLRVDSEIDERKDIVLSTIAAARHLRDLYVNYGDWYLALAAYNAGSGTVNRAIKKTRQRDFWVMARSGSFRTETVRYVARYVAASMIVSSPESYGLKSGNTRTAAKNDNTRYSDNKLSNADSDRAGNRYTSAG